MRSLKKNWKRAGLIALTAICIILMMSVPATAATKKYKSQWVKTNGNLYYYDKNGKKLKGLKKISGKYYYFDSKYVQRVGWQKINNDYYYFNIAHGKKGYMQKSKTVDGITLDKNGKAKKTSDALDKLGILIKANQVVEKITNANMTRTQKLKKCFDYTKTTYKYTTWRKFSAVKNWERAYAKDMFYKGRGNCFSYASAFAYLANALGYTNLYVVSSGGHGWVEINGKVYDPDWALVSKVDTYFAMPYSRSGINGRPNYKRYRVYLAAV